MSRNLILTEMPAVAIVAERILRIARCESPLDVPVFVW
jgi:hypothetical protein